MLAGFESLKRCQDDVLESFSLLAHRIGVSHRAGRIGLLGRVAETLEDRLLARLFEDFDPATQEVEFQAFLACECCLIQGQFVASKHRHFGRGDRVSIGFFKGQTAKLPRLVLFPLSQTRFLLRDLFNPSPVRFDNLWGREHTVGPFRTVVGGCQ